MADSIEQIQARIDAVTTAISGDVSLLVLASGTTLEEFEKSLPDILKTIASRAVGAIAALGAVEPEEAQVAQAPSLSMGGVRPSTTIDVSKERYDVNDALTQALAGLGWSAQDDQDYDWLNELTHFVADGLEGPAANEPLFVSDKLDEAAAKAIMDEDGYATVRLLVPVEGLLDAVGSRSIGDDWDEHDFIHERAFSFGLPHGSSWSIVRAGEHSALVQYTTGVGEFIDKEEE